MSSSLIESHYMHAAEEALEAFPIQADEILPICHSENLTFRVVPSDGQTHYALRLHRPGYNTLEELNSERQWTRALKEAGLLVPESLATKTGQHFHPIEIRATGERRFSGMTTWLEGIPLDEYLPGCTRLQQRQGIYRQIGAMAARSHNQSASWKEPPCFQRRMLDTGGLVGENPHWGRFWEHASLTPYEGRLLERTRQQIHRALDKYGRDVSMFGLIHADLNQENIVIDNGKLAMIDFDDAAYGWHMYDIASALFDERNHSDFESLRSSVLDGYQAIRPLGQRDILTFDMFILVRGLALIGWFHQRPEHDEQEFFLELKETIVADCAKFEPMTTL